MPVPGRDVRFHAKGQPRPDDRPRTCKTIVAEIRIQPGEPMEGLRPHGP